MSQARSTRVGEEHRIRIENIPNVFRILRARYFHPLRRGGRSPCFLPGGRRPEFPGGAVAARVPSIVFHVPRTDSTSRRRVPGDRAGPPGFGFTEVPAERKYVYSFDRLAATLNAFTQALRIRRYALYVFDYGAPTGFRLAMAYPDRSPLSFPRTAMPMKKGSAMPGGRSGNTGLSQHRRTARSLRKNILTLEGTRWQYTHGVGNPESVPPESYTLDAALLERPGNKDIQLDLFLDYASNVKLYPAFQDYFRKAKPPLLAIWGKNDPFFVPAGAEAFRKDIPNARVEFLDTGHFAIETHVVEIAAAMKEFLAANGVVAPDR